MKKNDRLIWSLIAALCLMVVIAGVLLLRSYNTNKDNQQAMTALEANLTSVSDRLQQTSSDRDALQTQVKTMTQEAEQAAKDAEDLQARYDAATARQQSLSEQLTTAQADLTALQEELQATQASAAQDAKQSADQAASLNEQLTKSKTELDNARAEKEALDQSITTLNDQLSTAAEKETALDAQVKTLQEDLEAAKTAAAQDAEQSAAQVTSLNEQLTKTKTELDNARAEKEALDQSITALKGQLTAAAEKEKTLNGQIKTLQEELEAARASATEDAQQSAQQVAALSSQLKKAQEDLAAASEKTEALNQSVASLGGQLAAAKAAADKDATSSAAQLQALNTQLTKAREELAAASEQEETLGKTIEDLNGQLAAAKSAADQDAKQSVAKIASLNEKLTNAQTQLEAARAEKATQDQAVTELNDQLTAAKAAAETEAEQFAAQVSGLNDRLTKAQADLDNAKQEKETLNQSITALQEQLAAAKAAAETEAEQSAAQVTDLNAQLATVQAELETARQEKETLTNELTAAQTAAGKAAEEAAARETALQEQITQTQTTLESTEKSLETTQKEKETLNKELTAAQTAAGKAAEEAAAREAALNAEILRLNDELAQTKAAAADTAAALEQKNQTLTEEAEQLRAGLEAETQQSARLQEELDVQSARPEALHKRLEAVDSGEDTAKEEVSALASLILRAFRESILPDASDSVTHPVPATVLMDGQQVITVSYDLTEAQEAQAYEAAKQVNDSQQLYQIDLNHGLTAALTVNGTAFGREAFESVYAEVFTHHPAADQAALNRLTADEMIKAQVLREHAEAIGIDADAADMESRLWEEALKNVEVGEADFSAALEKRQAEEDALLAADPAQYAQKLEAGEIASAVLPEGSRFIKQLIVPVDTSELEEIVPEQTRLQEQLDEVNEIINGKKAHGDALKELEGKRSLLSRQVSQLNSDRKLLLGNDQRAMDKAAGLGEQLRSGQLTFEDAAAQAQPDAAMPATGYAVFSGAAISDEAWAEAALALEKPGDASAPLRLADGYHVLYYSEEITADSAVIQTAREALRQEVLSDLRDATRESLLNQWISEADVTVNVK